MSYEETKLKYKNKLIDNTIIYDYSHLPRELINDIEELEILNEKGDIYMYDSYYGAFESCCKSYLMNNEITEEDFTKIQNKYGGIYD